MKRVLACCVMVWLTTVIAVNVWGQAAATADLRVAVKDPHGAFIPAATVTLRDTERNLGRVMRSTTDGQCRFLSLRPGEYAVVIEANGFARLMVEQVTVTVGQMAELPVTMHVAGASETVTVSSEAEMIEPQRSSIGSTIGRLQIANLPINGRNYINFALTDSKLGRDPGPFIGVAPTSGLTFAGQRPRANLVNVDGADAVDNSINGIRSTVSQDAVQEFQVLTSGYTAEFGRAAGGVVNIITRSGTNDFHGSTFGYLRNRHLQAVNRFSTEEDPAYTRVQTGVTAGGPVKRQKTFYFFSYEGMRRRESGFSSIGADDFGLVSFDTTPLAPFLGLGGASFGTVWLTKEQVGFLGRLKTGIQGLGQEQQQMLTPALQSFLAPYLTLAGGGSGVAVNGALPSPVMLPVVSAIATRNSLSPPSGLGAFATSGAPLPASFVTLNSLRGNYPVIERTDLYSLRLDHRLTQSQTGTLRVGFSPSYVVGIQSSAAAVNFGQSAGSRAGEQNFHDWTVGAQHTWVIGGNKVNELRFQYAYRGLLYTHSQNPGGSNPGINIAGFAVFGREPFSYAKRNEQRYQFTETLSVSRGGHMFKFGVDVNFLPMSADYTMQFGGVYTIGALGAGSLMRDASNAPIDQLDLTGFGLGAIPVPGLSAIQAYGLGVPQSFAQGVGNPHDRASNKVFAGFWQDTWRMRRDLTLNYGVRYDVELTPELRAINPMSQAAEDALGVTEGIPRDMNNIAPRIGLAWNPTGTKTVVRASYGLFYDHPPMAMVFNSDVVDGAQAPQIALFGDAPGCTSTNRNFLNATNSFQGLLSCLPAAFNYVAAEQRFNPTPDVPSVFVGQRYLAAGVPLLMQPVALPVARDFRYAYVNQANLAVEHEIGRNVSFALEYNFNGGRHLARPRNANAARGDLLKLNYERALAAINTLASSVPASVLNQLRPADPLSVAICPAMLERFGSPPVSGSANFVPAALVSFFRPSGMNPSLLMASSPFVVCGSAANAALQEFGLGAAVPVPFSDMHTTFSDASSAYHGLTARLHKRMARHYEVSASYTWSHAIDNGSTDLPMGVGPQDFYHPERERSNSVFDQRHRFVFMAVVQSGTRFARPVGRLLNNWTVAPVVEVNSGHPFNIVTYTDRNFDFVAVSDRPMVVPAGTAPNACGDAAKASRFSPSGYFQLPCYKDATPTYTGNLGRNAGMKPWTVFNDIRVARHFRATERLSVEGSINVFNIVNRFNVLDVNPLYIYAGMPTAASDPRQFEIAIRLSW